LTEPSVLPAGVPNLVVNGSSGIAVGMATNIPPHNMRETIAALVHLIDNPECTPADIRKHIKGPDFPTGGYIYGRAGITDYKHTQMQSTFGVIMLALVPDAITRRLVPKIMPLKEVLEHYLAHRHEVIVRRAQYELDKALEREHILEGLKIAVDNIDAVIKLI